MLNDIVPPVDVSAMSYASKSFSISSQDTEARGMVFKADGTKVFVMGRTNQRVYQYTLSTAWDISTASYDSKSLLTSGQTSDGDDIALSADGSKLYVMGRAGDTIYQYTLSTPWDASTGSYASKSLSVTSQATNPFGLAISTDGETVWVADANDTIYQYTLSTPWDISTGSYASKSFSATSQATGILGICVSADSNWLVVADTSTDALFNYSFGTAGDASTLAYATDTLSVSSQTTNPQSVALRADHSSAYVLDFGGTIYQYSN